MKTWIVLALTGSLAACIVQPAPPPLDHPYPPPPPPQYYAPPPPPPPQYAPPPPSYPPPDGAYNGAYNGAPPPSVGYGPPPAVVSVYVDPPMQQPEPIGVPWAPPPMLVEDPGPMPYYGAIWTGGYWVWDGQWIWAHGRWLAAPMAGYGWTHPYYENRQGVVVFIPGYWRAPGAEFVAPAAGLSITVVAARPGIVAGPRPEGPNGVFVPPPPGSRPGLIVPAPVGTSPAVVVGAPALVRSGMQVRAGENGNVRIDAPSGSTSAGKAYSATAPGQAHLAAAQPAQVRALAPAPASATPIRSYSPRQGFAALPPARPAERALATMPPARVPGQPGVAAVRAAPVRPPAPKPAAKPEHAEKEHEHRE